MKFPFGLHRPALAYSMTTLGAGMMNSIFNFYYVKLFLNRYKISEGAFHQAQLLVLIGHSLLSSIGYYKVILYVFYVEAVSAVLMLLLGPQHYYILAAFLTTNMVLVHASFSIFNLPLADIVDADFANYKRKSPLSSMVFGTNALFTKPAQSLAPMFVVTILNQYGYEHLTNKVDQPDPNLFLGLHDAMFYLTCFVPLCVATIQIIVWTPYSNRTSHVTNGH